MQAVLVVRDLAPWLVQVVKRKWLQRGYTIPERCLHLGPTHSGREREREIDIHIHTHIHRNRLPVTYASDLINWKSLGGMAVAWLERKHMKTRKFPRAGLGPLKAIGA